MGRGEWFPACGATAPVTGRGAEAAFATRTFLAIGADGDLCAVAVCCTEGVCREGRSGAATDAFFGDGGLPEQDREKLVSGARRLGAAFQKVNFLRDLDADADALDRAYFPGVDPARLDEPTKLRLVDDIDADLEAAAAAIPLLPRGVRPAVQAAHDLFGALNARIRDTDAHVVRSSRIRVPDTTKVAIAVRAVAKHRWGR